MCHITHVFVFIVLIEVIRQGHAAVLTAGTADTDRQMALLFFAVFFKHEIQIGQTLLDVTLGQLGIQDIISDRPVITGA